MSEPRPEPDSEVAGEPEYGNDTGFAADATATGQSAGSAGSADQPTGQPITGATPEDADGDDPGRGAD